MMTIRLERNMADALYEIKVRDGIPVSEQIRRALELWLKEKRDAPTDRKKKS